MIIESDHRFDALHHFNNRKLIVLYHKKRNVWRVLSYTEKSNWHKELKNCHKSIKYAYPSYTTNTIRGYYKNITPYLVFVINEGELDRDLKTEYAEYFI